MKSRFFCEESARLFCEAAFFCYFINIDSQGYRFQQLVFEILCAIKEPVRYYEVNDLMKVTRILFPGRDSGFLDVRTKLEESTVAREKVSEETGLPIDTNPTNAELLEAIEIIAPEAREAFSRGNFQESAELWTDIVRISNFNVISGVGKLNPYQPELVPLGEILCLRGIAYLQMNNFETAVDDFNASTCVDIQHYRGYYWKAYALCKLVQSGRTEFISRAQAATAVLHFKFAHSKSDDIQKLQNKFPGLLDRIEYKFVTQVSELKDMERSSEVHNDGLSCSFTVILADGRYDLKKMNLLGGQYYFVCPPGSSASINCINGLHLSRGSFLFENVEFINPYTLRPADADCTELGEAFSTMTWVEGNNFETVTLGRLPQTKTELSSQAERNLSALIEANDIHSLVIDHCVIDSASYSGIVVTATECTDDKRSVSVRSSNITDCRGTGLYLQGDAPFYHISVHNNLICGNLYGIVIDSPSPFHLENNDIGSNDLSGVVAVRASEGRLLRNSLHWNGKHGILLNKTNAVVEKNVIFSNRAWGMVCCCESNLQCLMGKELFWLRDVSSLKIQVRLFFLRLQMNFAKRI